jgi:hypothetical protein
MIVPWSLTGRALQFKDTCSTFLNALAVTVVISFGTGDPIASLVVFGSVLITLVASHQIFTLSVNARACYGSNHYNP